MSRLKKLMCALIASVLAVLIGVQPVSAATYSLSAASKWAIAHSQDKQPDFNGCQKMQLLRYENPFKGFLILMII